MNCITFYSHPHSGWLSAPSTSYLERDWKSLIRMPSLFKQAGHSTMLLANHPFLTCYNMSRNQSRRYTVCFSQIGMRYSTKVPAMLVLTQKVHTGLMSRI